MTFDQKVCWSVRLGRQQAAVCCEETESYAGLCTTLTSLLRLPEVATSKETIQLTHMVLVSQLDRQPTAAHRLAAST